MPSGKGCGSVTFSSLALVIMLQRFPSLCLKTELFSRHRTIHPFPISNLWYNHRTQTSDSKSFYSSSNPTVITTMSPPPSPSPTSTPDRQIRALSSAHTITLYQAYSPTIAFAAVSSQRLSASPSFSLNRMTWIKPSWCWMLYRSGYSYKDANQSRILALSIPHAKFRELLMEATLSHTSQSSQEGEKKGKVRVQWDPERGPRLEVLPYRSIQIGVGTEISKWFVEECVVGIEDVTERAREMKKVLDEDTGQTVGVKQLMEMGLMPRETEYEIDEELRGVLGMA